MVAIVFKRFPSYFWKERNEQNKNNLLTSLLPVSLSLLLSLVETTFQNMVENKVSEEANIQTEKDFMSWSR